MTILFFARRFYPLIGGVEKHVMELSKGLVGKGHRVIVLTERTSSDLKAFETLKLENGRLEIIRIYGGTDGKFKKVRLWKALWNLRNIIRTADVIHCHDVFFWYLPFRFLYPRKAVFTTFHGYETYPITKKAIIIRKFTEMLSNGNICIGDFIKKWYKTNPTYVSYGAVAQGSNIPQANQKNKTSAVFIGRLDEQTGILTYVKGVELVRKKYPKFIMTAVGDGEYGNKIANKVKIVGFQKNPEKFLVNAHFAFVSRYLAILEAFAAKRLVFAVYDNPVKEDYLKMAPFAKHMIIVEKSDELSQKILYFLKHPDEEKKIIENAYKWVHEQSWEKMIDLYLSLWRK